MKGQIGFVLVVDLHLFLTASFLTRCRFWYLKTRKYDFNCLFMRCTLYVSWIVKILSWTFHFKPVQTQIEFLTFLFEY